MPQGGVPRPIFCCFIIMVTWKIGKRWNLKKDVNNFGVFFLFCHQEISPRRFNPHTTQSKLFPKLQCCNESWKSKLFTNIVIRSDLKPDRCAWKFGKFVCKFELNLKTDVRDFKNSDYESDLNQKLLTRSCREPDKLLTWLEVTWNLIWTKKY